MTTLSDAPTALRRELELDRRLGVTARELATENELIESFRLRAQVYRTTGLRAFLSENAEIDVDSADQYSTHLGLFLGGELIGTMRSIHYRNAVENTKNHELGITGNEDETSLPMFRYSPYAHVLRSEVEHSLATHSVIEAGRFAIKQGFRGLRYGAHLIEAAISFVVARFENVAAFGIVHRHHVPMYHRYGYRPVDGTAEHSHGGNSCVPITARYEVSEIVERTDAIGRRLSGLVDAWNEAAGSKRQG